LFLVRLLREDLDGRGRDTSFEGAGPANDQDQFDGAPLDELAMSPIRPPSALGPRADGG
jgi:hypothetical protein